MKYQLEICTTSIESSLNAELAGANRIEICDNYYEGGTTPSFGMLKLLKGKLTIDINVLIRPRGGDFVYNELEYETIKKDVEFVKSMGLHGVVIGFLTVEGKIDKDKTKKIVELAKPLSVTFHRAFDLAKDPFDALEDVIDCGCDRILTSGQTNSAEDGLNLISELVSKAEERIIIMPGAGINSENIARISSKSKAKEFHLSGKAFRESSMKYRKENVLMNAHNIPEHKILYSDESKIKQIVELLKTL